MSAEDIRYGDSTGTWVAPALAARPGVPEPQVDQTRAEWAASVTDWLQAPRESSMYLRQVGAWRRAWRPAEVRSPVPLPTGFCRLVYCLGYGESDICEPVAPAKNVGTWQFWDLFGAVASKYDPSLSPRMPRRGQSDLNGRLTWKLNVLDTLRRAGVWLEDASVLALYSPGGRRLAAGADYRRIVRASFEGFVWPEVATDRPEQVWIIGQGVGGALAGLPGIDSARVISQPQDRDAARWAKGLNTLLTALPV